MHSAPAYGLDDFMRCTRYGMRNDEILTPVQGDGRFADSLPHFGGLNVWDGNPRVIEKPAEVDCRFASGTLTHSYMHCWRHKTPVIYRATTQWFVGMDRLAGRESISSSDGSEWANEVCGRNSRLTWAEKRGDTHIGVVEFPILRGDVRRTRLKADAEEETAVFS